MRQPGRAEAAHPAELSRYAVDRQIVFEQSPLGGTIARLTHGAAEARVALHGAQVLNWLIGGAGLLWLSPTARIRSGRGIRGGIPVCWPWFADHPDDPKKPAHGFVRHREWQVASTSATADAVSIVLATAPTDTELALWPYQAELRLTVRLGAGLGLSLETRNIGTTPILLTEALHTYFRVSDIASVTVTGLEGRSYLDKLEGFARKTQAGPITIAGEVDRIYVGDVATIALEDRGLDRRIRISSVGSRSAVVWNPWTAKTARLGDMGSPDAFRQMLCIETANAGDDVVTLPPGRAHTLGVSYSA